MSVDCVNHLGFHRPLTSLVKESLVVRNPNNRPVAFKVKTTAPKQYCVRPNSGRIEPGQEVEVQILLQAMKEEPPLDTKCRDKFLVQSTIINAEHDSSSISDLWSAVEAKNRDDIHEKKIRCVFIAQDGVSNHHAAAHDSYDGTHSPAAFHTADMSSSNIRQPEPATKQQTVAEKSDLFNVQPALAPRGAPSASTASSSEDQLREAKAKIEQLTKQLTDSSSKLRSAGPQTALTNQGVPVRTTAIIALIAFMAAYLLF